MKLSVAPIYGWGWFTTEGDSVDEPAPFILECSSEETIGFMDAPGHPLTGLWIELTVRHGPPDDNHNLRASRDAAMSQIVLTGYAQVTRLDGETARP